jgi:hypothetical protein
MREGSRPPPHERSVLDNDVFRQTYREVNERVCPYEKSILTNKCRCSKAKRFCIAEREGVHCLSDAAQAQCLQLLDLLRHQARFALRANDERSALPHGKAMRIQVGGLRGLLQSLEPENPLPETIDDIHGVIQRARETFGDLNALPFAEIIRQIAAYRGRPPRAPRNRR